MIRVKFFQGLTLAVIATLLLSFSGIALLERALAQAAALSYGSVVTARIALASPLGSYTFSGVQGDFVEIEVVSLTQGFNPNLTIVTPSNALLTAIDDDVFGYGNGDAYSSAVLPEDGTVPPPVSACRSVVITQPNSSGGLPNGGATIFWDSAPGATSYEVTIRNNENGATVGTSTSATSATLDVSSGGPLGAGFGLFTVNVRALAGSTFLCSGEVSVPREAGGGDPGGSTCGNNVCEPGELGTFGTTAVFQCTTCNDDCNQLPVCP